MREYTRTNPLFSLCGLNCGLCPRYHTNGKSKCPGCGGKNFHLLRPGCALITCSKKHGDIEYCFCCDSFPCPRYESPSEKDSFITYRNVLRDLHRAKEIGIERYQQELNEKISLLETLLEHYNDGKRKGFYCTAVNLLEPSDLSDLKEYIISIENNTVEGSDKIGQIVSYLLGKAKSRDIDLTLR